MKGASADPSASTSRPPTRSSAIITGTSQYFLRARRNCQSSRVIDIFSFARSELAREVVVRQRIAREPVTLPCAGAFQPQRVAAREPHQQPDGAHHPDEQERECHWAYHAIEQLAQRHPPAIERGERSGTCRGEEHER